MNDPYPRSYRSQFGLSIPSRNEVEWGRVRPGQEPDRNDNMISGSKFQDS